MNLGHFLYRAVNSICRADITRVLVCHVNSVPTVAENNQVLCQWIDSQQLEALMCDDDFQISRQFVDDFKQAGFLGVSAMLGGEVAGILFLVNDGVAARHNSAGAPFKGIGLELPPGVLYLFKVAVKPNSRGKKVNASMLTFAAGQLASKACDTIVTTTDWTNSSFLKSVENFGFRRCGFASEFVIRGRYFYKVPTLTLPAQDSAESVDSNTGTSQTAHDGKSRTITFTHA